MHFVCSRRYALFLNITYTPDTIKAVIILGVSIKSGNCVLLNCDT